MFVGHYAAALAAKAAEPRGPLWTYVLGCQLIDVGWSALVATGAERFSVDPSLPGSGLVLEHMPYTHSLPGALAWSIAAGLLAVLALKLPRRAGVAIGLVVFSHWILDLVVHRPDLALWFGGPKVGLALWNYPVPEQALEMGLLAIAAAAWVGWRVRDGRKVWPAAAFLALLVGVQLYAMLMPLGADPIVTGATAIAAYLGLGLVAWFVERGPVDAAAGLRARGQEA